MRMDAAMGSEHGYVEFNPDPLKHKYSFGGSPPPLGLSAATDVGLLATYVGLLATDVGLLATDVGLLATDVGLLATDVGLLANEFVEFKQS